MSNLATIVNNILADSGIDDINVVVTTGSYNNPAWITALGWSKISGTPTTLAGYGITDAVPSSRTLTINGVGYDLSANRSWTIAAGVSSIIAGTGISVSGSGDITVTNTGVLSINGSTGNVTGIATTAQLANYLPLSGGTMTGAILLSNNVAIRDSAGEWIIGKNSSDIAIGSTAVTNSINFYSASASTFAYRGNAILHAGNYNSYAPTLTGGGASGTWGISISGNAATVSSITGNTGLMVNRLAPTADIDGLTNANFRTTLFGTTAYGNALSAARWNVTPSALSGMNYYGTMIAWSGNDTHGFFAFDYSSANVQLGGGSGDSITWKATLIHSSNYNSYSPTLTGSGASGTWGINITGNSAYASSAGNADTVDGYHASTSNIGNYIVVRDGNGYIFGNYINMTDDGNPGGGASITSFITKQGDNYYRSVSPTNAMASIRGVASGSWGINITGSSSSSSYATSAGSAPTISLTGLGNGSVNVNYGSTYVLRNENGSGAALAYSPILHAGGGDTMWQIQGTYGTSGNGTLYFRQGYDGSWGNWLTMLSSANYGSYALPISGGTMTGNITLKYTTANTEGYNALTFAPGSDDYIIKASTTYGVFGRSSFGWHVNSSSAFGVYSSGWTKLFGVEGGTGNTQVFGNFYAPIFYDSANTSYYLDPASSSTSLRIAGGIAQNNIVGRPAAYWGSTGTTGAVVIKFPGGSGNYGMVHAVIDIYEYNGNNVSTVIVGGHNWNGAWYNFGANVIGYTDKPVRLGFKDGKYCIVIGNGSSYWSYGQVVLRKIQNGTYYDGVMDVANGYTVGIESDSYSWISGDLRGMRIPGNLTVGASGASTITMIDTDEGSRELHCNSNRIGFLNQSSSWGSYCTDDGSWYSDSAMYAPIYYDLNNTNYYMNPADTSVFNGVKANKMYQNEWYLDMPGSNDGSYRWVRFPMGWFNSGGMSAEIAISRSINDNGNSPYGGCTARFIINSREWHSGQDNMWYFYTEHGSGNASQTPYGYYIYQAGPRDLAGGGYWFYMRLLSGIRYRMSVSANMNFNNNVMGGPEYDVADPGGVQRITLGSGVIGSNGNYNRISSDNGMFSIIYDKDNTSYYMDMAGSSVLGNIGLGGVYPDVRLSISGDMHVSGFTYGGGTPGSVGSWGSRAYTSSGVYYLNASSHVFNNVGYGGTWSITFNGSGITANAFYESSDSRLKELIEDAYIASGIENVKAKLYKKNGKIEIGYLAQEVEAILPTTVIVGDDKYLNLSYREIHTAKIAYLEQKVLYLENQLKQIQNENN